ncbi:hypothetical protein QBC40DRAFT_318709 [Triangularia verruculosa]|uniref:DUF7580 domain-containing protein n=1 Tax=Triangularia verruculosa TaxID=2587418 RepID=A0AAN7AXG9_9PEZI|nr:hypothetical protein QBC40DRAFT_318709 [Triangularia verruculosa]
MSGFEVAGVVLGSIPLLISALEYYSQGVSTLQKWRKYEREFRCLIRNLQIERVKLQNVCEKLLNGLVPLSKFETMIKSPGGEEWRTESIQRKIRQRLWEACDVFDQTIQDVKLATDELQQRLGSQNDGKVSELRRGIFTLRRSTYDDLLQRIKEGISNLENLTDRNIELEPSRKVRSQGKLFHILRNISNSLYRALRSSLACGCQHDLGVKLERRSFDIMPADDEERIICALAFQFAVSSLSKIETSLQDPKHLSTQTWQKVLVKATPSPSPLPSPLPPKGKKTVSFGFSHSMSSSTTTTLVKTATHTTVSNSICNPTTTMASLVLSNINPTINLCQTFQKTSSFQQADSPYGVIIDQQTAQAPRQYTVYPSLQGSGAMPIWTLISLREILEHKDRHIPISYRDRLYLALVISSNILQIHGTPWVPDTLDSRNVFFLANNGFPLYSHPIFVKNHEDVAKLTLPSSPSDGGVAFVLDREPKLLSLGFLLIELMLGQTLDALRVGTGPGSFPEGSLLSKYVTAQHVLPRVRTESLNYWTAVTRCLDGDLHTRRNGPDGTGLDRESLCEEVYSGVVALLEKDYENSC